MTWRWNVNTTLSGSSHICLHPSSCFNPLLYSPHAYLLSLSLPLPSCIIYIPSTEQITGLSLLRGTFDSLLMWDCCCISIRFVPPMNLVFHRMQQSGCTSICTPCAPDSVACVYVTADHNGRTFQGKAAHSSKPASHVTVQPSRGGRG